MLIALMLVIALTFMILAMMNRGKTADAGHVFLVAGFAGCCSVLIFASIAHADEIRNFDNDQVTFRECIDDVQRSQGANLFNRTLVEILDERLPNDPDVPRLRGALLEPLDIANCGDEPTEEPQFIDALF